MEYKVGGITYKVVEVPFIEIDGDRNFQGLCDYRQATIQILESLSRERKAQIIIHELTHAIFYEAGYDEQDEDMINRIGNVLHQTIEDNFD